MIYNLHFLRGMAALFVVFYHLDIKILAGTGIELFGVPTFFALSGFLMAKIASENPVHFLRNRLIRIVPLYWVLTLLFAILAPLGLLNPWASIPWLWSAITNFTVILEWIQNSLTGQHAFSLYEIACSLFFIPYAGKNGSIQPILGVGWTLNLEIALYVLFSVAIFIDRARASWIVVGVIFCFPLLHIIGDVPKQISFYASYYCICFAAGILSFKSIKLKYPSLLNIIIFSILFFIYREIPKTGIIIFFQELGLRYPYVLLMVGTSFVLKSGIPIYVSVYLEKKGYKINFQITRWLGDISYALYLTHTLVFEVVRPLGWVGSEKTFFTGIIAVLISLFVATVVHIYIEKPLISYLNYMFKRSHS